jgi:hypothetical protein
VFLHGERINVNITPLQASNFIALSNLQIYLKVKLGICQLGKGIALHLL